MVTELLLALVDSMGCPQIHSMLKRYDTRLLSRALLITVRYKARELRAVNQRLQPISNAHQNLVGPYRKILFKHYNDLDKK